MTSRVFEITQPKKQEGRWGKPVLGISLATGDRYLFPSLGATKDEGFSPSRVKMCCEALADSYAGFRWRWAKPEDLERAEEFKIGRYSGMPKRDYSSSYRR
jgi:hypothetical protein